VILVLAYEVPRPINGNALASLSSVLLNVQVRREQPRSGVGALKVRCPQAAIAVARVRGTSNTAAVDENEDRKCEIDEEEKPRMA
jgi:hypothetical protein